MTPVEFFFLFLVLAIPISDLITAQSLEYENKKHPSRKSAFEMFDLLTDESSATYYSKSSDLRLTFKNVEFGVTGAKSLEIVLHERPKNQTVVKFEIRLDRSDGLALVDTEIPNNEKNNNETFPIIISVPITHDVQGTHDIHISSTNPSEFSSLSFYFKPSGPRAGVFYSLMSMMNGKVITNQYGYAKLLTFKNDTTQLFQFVQLPHEPTFYTIMLKNSENVLTVEHETMNLEQLVLKKYLGLRNQQWRVQESPNGENLRFMVRHSGQCIDVQAGNELDNANLIQYVCNNWAHGNQDWMIMNPLC